MAVLARPRPGGRSAPPLAPRWRLGRAEAIPLALVALLTLFGGFLRRYHLGQQGLWFDEADLVVRAQAPVGQLLRAFVRPGENGPLYTLGLALWLKIFGISEAAVRLPSAIAGTLAIPALYGLGRALRGPRFGVIAAALLVVSPYAHWYAQDAKMYSLAVLLAIVGTWLLLVALRRGGAAWGAYAATMAVGVFIHATLVFILIAHAVVLGVLWRRGYGNRPRGRQAKILAALIGVACVPLVVWAVAFAIGDVPTWHGGANPVQIVHAVLVEFGATHRADSATQTAALWLYLALAVAGIVLTSSPFSRSATPLSPEGREQGVGSLVPLAITIIPVLLFVLLALRQAIFEGRYLLVALPGYLLLVALGLDGLLRWRVGWAVAAVAGAAALFLAWTPLHTVNLSTQSQKEDWRAAYQHIAEHARPGDVALLAPGYLRTTYDYYVQRFPALRDVPVVAAPSLAPQRAVSGRTLDAFFADTLRDRQRVWVLTSPERIARDDPEGRIETFFNGTKDTGGAGTEFERQQLNGVLVQCETLNGPYGNGAYRPPPQVQTEVHFGESGIGLFGATLQTRDGTNRVARGAFAPLLLRWTVPDRPIPTDYTVLVRLVDGAGNEVGRYDIPPLDGHWRTSTWAYKEDPYDPHDLHIPPDLAPGQYRILVGLAPVSDPSHPLPIFTRDGSPAPVTSDGLLTLIPVTVG